MGGFFVLVFKERRGSWKREREGGGEWRDVRDVMGIGMKDCEVWWRITGMRYGGREVWRYRYLFYMRKGVGVLNLVG